MGKHIESLLLGELCDACGNDQCRDSAKRLMVTVGRQHALEFFHTQYVRLYMFLGKFIFAFHRHYCAIVHYQQIYFSKITSDQVKYDVVDSYGKLMALVK